MISVPAKDLISQLVMELMINHNDESKRQRDLIYLLREQFDDLNPNENE